MARHGGRGGHGMHGGHGGRGGHGMRGRPRGRMPHLFPMFGYGRMMGISWLVAPFMGILFIMILIGSFIGTSTNFTTILGLLCIVGAFFLLYQMRSKEKTKRKRGTNDDEYDAIV